MKRKLLYLTILATTACSIAILILIFVPSPMIMLLQFIIVENQKHFRIVIGVLIVMYKVIHYLLTMKYHELAHWEEAAKYHILKNPSITDSHFECANWEDFINEKEKIRKVTKAGIMFDIKNNMTGLLLSLMEPWIIPFIMLFSFGNAFPIKFSEKSATDAYWSRHTEEFIKSKLI